MESELEQNSRIEALEVKVAYQERLIDELNSVVVRLRSQLERLTPQLKELAERVKPLIEQQEMTAGQDKPPHY